MILLYYHILEEFNMNQKKSLKLKENLLGYGFLSPALILLLIFLVIPVCMVVYYAFTDYYLLTPDDRKFIGLENFIRLFKDPIFLKSVVNTAQFVVWIIPIQLGAALGMALIVNKKRKGNMFFKVAFFAPVVMSLVVISILWLYLLNPNNGLLNALLNKIGIASQPFLRSPKQAMYAIVFVSALTKQRLHKLPEMIKQISESQNTRIPSAVLNDVIMDAIAINPTPTDKGKRLKIFYATQVATKPPTFVIFVNEEELMHFSYLRFLENQIRKAFVFEGTPIHLIARKRK